MPAIRSCDTAASSGLEQPDPLAFVADYRTGKLAGT
jgi:hypothetical protein